MENEYVKKAKKVSFVSLIINFLLSAVKLVAGLLAGSSAMVSDSVHSLSDCFSTIVVIIGVSLGGRAADKEHPFGHERLECVASLILSAILFSTAFLLGESAVKSIVDIAKNGGTGSNDFIYLAIGAAVLSIVVKFALYLYTEKVAKATSSSALHGDALHHLSDSLSSFGSLAGLVGVMLNVPLLDPIASLVICVMIVKAGVDIALVAVNQLVDRSAGEKTEEKMKEIILAVPGVIQVDVLRTRLYGNRIFAEVEIGVSVEESFLASHQIAERVHFKIEREFPNVKHCMVHANPVLRNGVEPNNHEDPSHEW